MEKHIGPSGQGTYGHRSPECFQEKNQKDQQKVAEAVKKE